MIRKFLITFFFLWLAGFFWFVESLPVHDDHSPRHGSGGGDSGRANEAVTGDVIVALTGGQGRVDAAFELLHLGAASKLLVTGVGTDVTLRELVVQDVPKKVRKPLSYYMRRVHLGYVARNTAGNAREANGWMVAHPVKSVVLVTSNYHMPRSLYLFREAFPELTVTPHPTFGPSFRSESWWRDSDVLALTFSEYHKLLMSYVLYGLMGARLV